MLNKNDSNRPILFYSENDRTFRTTLIGYLYDLAQNHRVILLSEKLDMESNLILKDRKLFPYLENIITVNQYERQTDNILSRHIFFSQLARNIIACYKPSMIFVSGHNLFEIYLRRHAKEMFGAISVACIGFLGVSYYRENILFLDLSRSYRHFPHCLPVRFRLSLARLRRWMSHFVFYIAAPVITGQSPFLDETGIFNYNFKEMENIDHSFVFTVNNYNMLIENGIPEDKLFVLCHPLQTDAKAVMKYAYLGNCSKPACVKAVTIFIDIIGYWSFCKNDQALIPDDQAFNNRITVIQEVCRLLPDWIVYIKPHPMSNKIPEFLEMLRAAGLDGGQIDFVSSTEPAEKYIELADIILGFPPASTALFTSLLQCEQKPVLAIDINRELWGDAYRNFDGIEYIDSMEKLQLIIESIENESYKKKKGECPAKGFRHITEALAWIGKGNNQGE
jgi:hypothetical protein